MPCFYFCQPLASAKVAVQVLDGDGDDSVLGGGRRYYGRGPLVRQSVTSEFSDKLVEVEHLLSLEQEGWCLMKEAFPARKLG